MHVRMNKDTINRKLLFAITTFIISFLGVQLNDQVVQFRGPQRNLIHPETGLPYSSR